MSGFGGFQIDPALIDGLGNCLDMVVGSSSSKLVCPAKLGGRILDEED